MSTTKGVTRFSVSLDQTLLKQFDRMRRTKGYENRSLAVADMIRDQLVEHRQVDQDYEAVGAVTLVYDHHRPQVQRTLTDLQHDFTGMIISSLHVHLDHHNCLEVIVLKGSASAIRTLADRLIGHKGVKHGKLNLTTTGKDLPS